MIVFSQYSISLNESDIQDFSANSSIGAGEFFGKIFLHIAFTHSRSVIERAIPSVRQEGGIILYISLCTPVIFEPSFAEKQLSLDVEGDVTAHIDRRLFHRSLANLLENSARHSPSNSTVTVRLSEKNNQAWVEVSNPGEPIAPEHLHRLFERFYRVDTSRARSDTHHGLGLSIVRAVAIMHRGDVFARSEDGINTFGLTFAVQADKAAGNAQTGTEPGPGLTDRIVRGASA